MQEALKDIARRLDAIEEHPDHCPFRESISDHERRLRVTERLLYLGMGGLTVLNCLGIWKMFSLTMGVGK
jgi:hypothetical protein